MAKGEWSDPVYVKNNNPLWSIVLSLLVLWAWMFGVPTTWGMFHIDIFPPAIRLVSDDGQE